MRRVKKGTACIGSFRGRRSIPALQEMGNLLLLEMEETSRATMELGVDMGSHHGDDGARGAEASTTEEEEDL